MKYPRPDVVLLKRRGWPTVAYVSGIADSYMPKSSLDIAFAKKTAVGIKAGMIPVLHSQ